MAINSDYHVMDIYIYTVKNMVSDYGNLIQITMLWTYIYIHKVNNMVSELWQLNVSSLAQQLAFSGGLPQVGGASW